MATLTSLNFVTPSAITSTAQIHVVITGDTSQGNPDGSSYKANLSDISSIFSIVDTYVTGFTYNDANTFTIKQNQGQSDLNASFNIVTGLTVNGVLSATTMSADTITTSNLTATNLNTTNLTANTLTTLTLSATSFFVSGQTYPLPWETKTNVGGITYNADANTNYVSNNGHPANPSKYLLPTTVSVGDTVKVSVLDGKASFTVSASQSFVYGTGDNDTGGTFTSPLAFNFGKYESAEATYLGSNKWVLSNFQTTEDLSINPLTNRIY